MFSFTVQKNKISVTQTETMTSGSVNVYLAKFEFSEDWSDLDKIAVFRSGSTVVDILLPENGECMVPWTVLTSPKAIYVGVYGTHGNDIVLPTNWASMGTIIEGVKPGFESESPTDPPQVTTGVSDHRQLTHRDAEGQHPINSISGLSEALDRIGDPIEPLTNLDLEELLT